MNDKKQQISDKSALGVKEFEGNLKASRLAVTKWKACKVSRPPPGGALTPALSCGEPEIQDERPAES